ncbi:MAG TPA: RNA polymerase sigma factor [Vicinamibacterales bacterium]|nr:RNA polymerase sigma factor [Vicinamibacterales bacterium]
MQQSAENERAAFETVMRRNNTRLFRVARAILRDENDAEDALQDAYLDAFAHRDEFRGGAQVSTWLTRIVINRALMRLRSKKRQRVVVPMRDRAVTGVDGGELALPEIDRVADQKAELPLTSTIRAEMRTILERRIDELPVAFRTVFVMREIEDMTVQETAVCLGIPEATVRTRLFRAKALLRDALARDVDIAAADAFTFAGERCDRIVATVLARLSATRDGGDTQD